MPFPSEDLTIFSLDVDLNWDVGAPTPPQVYWRLDIDISDIAGFDGSTPAVLGGDAKNDDDTAAADGYADESDFDSDDLPTPLIWGTTYTWRVTTLWPVAASSYVPQGIFDLDETDRVVGFSDLQEFSTVLKAIVPSPSYPIDGQVIPTSSPLLSWWVGAPFGDLTFDVQIWNAGITLQVCDGATITALTGLQYDTDDCATGLLPGTTYNWRVRSSDGTATSAFSAYEEFTTGGSGAAVAAIPSYPVDDLEIYTTAPELHWYTLTDVTGLDFVAWIDEQLGGTPAASCAVIQGSGTAVSYASATSTPNVDIAGLEPGTTYDWCVVTTGLNGSVDSDVASFMVSGGLLDAFPIAGWPVGNPTTFELDQLLSWYVEGSTVGLVDYDVEYCVDAAFGSGGPDCTTVTGITDTEYEIVGLGYGEVVVWRVRANYSGGSSSDWSNSVSQGGFTVTGLLSDLTAVLTYPVGDLIIYTSSPTLSWWVSGGAGAADMFKVQYSYVESFPAIGSVTTTLTTTDTDLDITGLIPGHIYWWKVAVSNDGGSTYGSYSAVSSFVVHPGAAAVMPRIGSPSNTVTITATAPTLSWILPAPSESQLVFDLRYSTESDLESATTIFELTDIATPFIQLTDLDAGQYFWQVRSRSTDGSTSAYSPVGMFTTTATFTVGVEEELLEEVGEELPQVFELGQNYPNPFNPTTTFEFRMGATTNVSIRVFNVLGQVVRTLVDGTMSAGVHRVTCGMPAMTVAPPSLPDYICTRWKRVVSPLSGPWY